MNADIVYLAPSTLEEAGGVDVLFAQYGAIGVIAGLALLAVKVLFKHVTANEQRERERADRLEAEVRKLNEQIRDEYMKTLSQASVAIAETNRVVSNLLSNRSREETHDNR